MKVRRYSAIKAAAKITDMESDDSEYDEYDKKWEVSWTVNPSFLRMDDKCEELEEHL